MCYVWYMYVLFGFGGIMVVVMSVKFFELVFEEYLVFQ